MRFLPVTLLAIVLAALLAGCGQAEGPAEPSGPTELAITVWPDGANRDVSKSYTLRCAPPAGEHPDPAAACAVLVELGVGAFAPLAPDMACTEIYGGPQAAAVRGTVAGAPVDMTLSRTNGCNIARWESLRAVVPVPAWDPLAPSEP